MNAKEALCHLVEVAVYGNKEDNRSHIFQAEEVITQAIECKASSMNAQEMFDEIGFKVAVKNKSFKVYKNLEVGTGVQFDLTQHCYRVFDLSADHDDMMWVSVRLNKAIVQQEKEWGWVE